MSLSHALAEINNLQTKLIRIQRQVEDQEVRIKKKEAVVSAAAPVPDEETLSIQRVNAQLDSQLSTMFIMANSVKGLDGEIRRYRKQSELAILMSIVSFLMTMTFFVYYTNMPRQI